MTTPQVVELSGPSFPVPSGGGDPTCPWPFLRRPTSMPAGPPVPPAVVKKSRNSCGPGSRHGLGCSYSLPKEAVTAARELAGGAAPETVPAHKIAQRLGADAALSGKVLVYQERVGSRLERILPRSWALK